MADTISPHFSRSQEARLFFTTLNGKIQSYFHTNQISKTGNYKLYIKTAIFSVAYLSFYLLLYIIPPNPWIGISLAIGLGIAMSGLGMNVMHEGNHGSYSSKPWVNRIMGASIYILAGNVYNWKVQHNLLHHTFTNVHGYDEDLDAGGVIRLDKTTRWRWYHKYQQWYFVFLYGLMTLNWAIFKDFYQIKRYLKANFNCQGKPVSITKRWVILILTKALYFIFWIVLPLWFLDYAWWKIIIGFLVMHYVAGLILSVIFQLAHVVESTETPLPDNKNNLENTWAIHQLYTTANFASDRAIVNWFSGGLNHQIEHHLFPQISHIHYKKLSFIVKETAKKFDLPYHEFKSTTEAIGSHFRHLKALAKKPKTK